jgi:hypothetical protein
MTLKMASFAAAREETALVCLTVSIDPFVRDEICGKELRLHSCNQRGFTLPRFHLGFMSESKREVKHSFARVKRVPPLIRTRLRSTRENSWCT